MKTKIQNLKKKIIEELDTLTNNEMYSGQPFAILQCFYLSGASNFFGTVHNSIVT